MEKRGISTLVATVLLILIVVAAVGIIWAALMPIFSTSSELSRACSESSIKIETSSGYSCYDENANEILLMIGRTSNVELAGVQVVISSAGTSNSFELQFGKPHSNVKMYTQQDYGLSLENINLNEDKTYIFDATGLEQVYEAKIAPIVKIGISEKKCSVSSKVMIARCISSSEVLFDLNVTGEV